MIAELTKKYLDAETTMQEEQMLSQLLQQKAERTGEEEALLLMLSATGRHCTKDQHDWLDPDNAALYDRIMAEREADRKPTFLTPRWRRMAGAAAVLTALVLGTTYITHRHSTADMAVAYIYGNRVDDSQVAMDMMRHTLSEVLDNPDCVEDQLTDILNP